MIPSWMPPHKRTSCSKCLAWLGLSFDFVCESFPCSRVQFSRDGASSVHEASGSFNAGKPLALSSLFACPPSESHRTSHNAPNKFIFTTRAIGLLSLFYSLMNDAPLQIAALLSAFAFPVI
ncbi:hypothetical protein TRVL_05097 [Trypanosoma vivax]|nr:hypothetical protein TRVL_05097 [Trypanosoma vivax]